MFRWLGRIVTTHAPWIVIFILLISMFFSLAIPSIEFKTNLNKFLPDNELVRANNRVGDYFGDDLVVHVIYVQEDNSDNDVLTLDSLYKQYDLYKICEKKPYVKNVVSIVSLMDELFQLYYQDNYTSFKDIDEMQLTFIKTQLFGMLNGDVDISDISQLLNIDIQITSEDLNQFVNLFFDKDFDYTSETPTAKSTLIIVFIDSSLSDKSLKKVSRDLRDTVVTTDEDHIDVSHTSSYLISSDLDVASSRSFSILGLVILGLIIVILSLSFRRITYVIIPLITLCLAVVWTFGTMILLGIEFTVITVAIIPLTVGLGVDYSVYISNRYQEELRKGKDISSALRSSVSSVGTAMFLAVLTTIIAFMSNLISNIEPVRDFGLICGLGIFYAFFLTITFHTSVRWLVDMKSAKNPIIGEEKELYVVKLGTHTASSSVIYYPILVLIIVIILTLGAITSAMNVRTEFNNRDFLPDTWESLETQSKIENSFQSSSFIQAYILLEDEVRNRQTGISNIATVETLNGILRITENIGNDKYIVQLNGNPRIESILNYIQLALKENLTLKNLVDFDGNDLPDDDAGVKIVFDYLLDNEFTDNDNSGDVNNNQQFSLVSLSDAKSVLYRNDHGIYESTLIRAYVNVKDSKEVREMYSELEGDISDEKIFGVKQTATGNVILSVTTMDSLQESQIFTTIISIIFAMTILIIIYRKPALGVIAITPVLISSVWILGTMSFFSISINVFTVSITALTIGLGIDYAIHIIERFREEIKKYDTRTAINLTIRNTGAALFISAITTVCGFIVLIISEIPPIQHFGIITSMTIIYSSILAMVVIPILLMKWSKNNREPKKSMRKVKN